MAKYSISLTTAAPTLKVCDIVRRRESDEWFATAVASGTFGSGTVAFQISFDGGTTKAPLNQDGTATAASLAALGAVNLRTGNSSSNTPPQLWATLSGSTGATVAVNVFDNR